MRFATAVILLSSFIGILGYPCENISGLWRNQLHSNMTIFHRSGHVITGQYSTAVETKFRAAIIASNITGIYKEVNDGGVLAFTVLFNHGKSVATWVGQCMECDGEEKLFTSWVLRTHLSKSVDRWMATRVNQDTFVRIPGEENIPTHLRTLGPEPKDDISSQCEKIYKVNSRGMWVDGVDDAFVFTDCRESGMLTGRNSEIEMIGRTSGENRLSSAGLTSIDDDLIRGWAGHMYDDKFYASWIEHVFVDSCKRPRRQTVFGVHEYSFDPEQEDASKPPQSESLLGKAINFLKSFSTER